MRKHTHRMANAIARHERHDGTIMSINDMTSGGRLRHILDQAGQNPQFRNKVILLGAMADDMTYPTTDKLMAFAPVVLEVAGEAGLLTDINQAKLDDLSEWFDDSANEVAFFARPRWRMPTSPLCETPTGHVFLSWTVKNPRDREALCGIKEALDWFNIQHFDYTEHQLDDKRDMNDVIVQQLEESVAKSQASVEVVSTEAGRPWIQYERSRIAERDGIHRFLVCLEWDKARFVRMDESQESRTTRIDMSGGRWGYIVTEQMNQWMAQASDNRAGESQYHD